MNETHSPSPPTALRVFDHQRLWRLDEPVFTRAAELLADYEASYWPEIVVGIARGGLPLARVVGRRLGADVVEMYVRHNTSDSPYVQATGNVQVRPLTEPFIGVCTGRRLLIADDICGSGATLRTVRELLTDRAEPASLRSVVLCRNVGAAESPDAWLWDTRDWVLFPWDETAAPAMSLAAAEEPLLPPDRVQTSRRGGGDR